MKPTESLQAKLYEEMLGRIKETDLLRSYRQAGYFYYSRTEKGKQYPIYCRKKGSLEATEQVMIRRQRDGEGERFMAVATSRSPTTGTCSPTPTTRSASASTAPRQEPLDGKDFPETVEKVFLGGVAADNKTLFYTVDDAAKRPYRLYRHALGSDPKDDALVFEEKDRDVPRQRPPLAQLEGPLPRLGLAHGRRVALPRGGQARGTWTLIASREKAHELRGRAPGDLFYIRTNRGCRNFRVVTAPVASPARRPEGASPLPPAVMVSGLNLFASTPSSRSGGRSPAHSRHRPRVRTQHVSRCRSPSTAVGPRTTGRVRHAALPLRLPVLHDAPVRYDYDWRRRSAAPERTRSSAATTLTATVRAPLRHGGRRARIPISLVNKKGFVADARAPPG